MRKLNSFTKDWNAKAYLQQYYSSNKISSDEMVTLKYLVDFFKKSNKTFASAIDVGSGPTLHQIIPIIPYVTELFLADFLPQNLREIQKWLDNKHDAHNWDKYIIYILELEGRGETLEQRKKEMRRKIKKLLPINISQNHPLGFEKTFPLVTSFYCADSVAKNKNEWKNSMHNIFNLVGKPGVLIVTALRNADAYQVLDKQFPSPHVNENDYKNLFAEDKNFIAETIEIQVVHNPEWIDAGFDSGILVKAEKPA